jgi:hypothetical protein
MKTTTNIIGTATIVNPCPVCRTSDCTSVTCRVWLSLTDEERASVNAAKRRRARR